MRIRIMILDQDQDQDQDDEDEDGEKRVCKSILHGRQVPFERLQLVAGSYNGACV